MFSQRKLLCFCIPIVIYTLFYFVYPIIELIISSLNFDGNLFSYYYNALIDPNFIQSIFNAVFYQVFITIACIFSSLLIAMLMYNATSKKLISSIQMSTYAPHLLSWVVIFGVWNTIFAPNGIVNALLINFNVIEPNQIIQFWANYHFARVAIVIMTAWKDLGYNALIFYVVLLSIPTNIHEVVMLEKDTFMNKVTSIYLPALKNTIFVMIMLITIGALKTFDSAFLVMNPITKYYIESPAVYAYDQGVVHNNLNLASAASIIFMIICLVYAVVIKKVVNKYEN